MSIDFWQIVTDMPLLVFLFLIIYIPYFLSKRINFISNKVAAFFTIFFPSLIISAIITVIATYYSEEFSKNFILKKFGYNFDGMNEIENYQNVAANNIQEIKNIRESQMGIGWPLKAIFGCVVFTLPITLISALFSLFTSSKKSQ